MLKTPLTVCLCSSFFLFPSGFAKDNSSRKTKSVHRAKTLFPSTDAPKAPMNKQEMLFVKHYILKSNRNLVTIRHRSRIPFNIIDSVFEALGLPRELKYLAVIESELKPSATSRVGALGPWQLMPATAHILGLKTTRRNDERMNYYKSTVAAARYLKDLYAEFGDWLLVIAAYNGGPRPVYSAIHQSGSRNFWILQSHLPVETRHHVKKFIATHYYFEGQGSLTTLTKSETAQYMEAVKAFASTQQTKKNSVKDSSCISKESPEQKFLRLMKASEVSLSKSNQALDSAHL